MKNLLLLSIPPVFFTFSLPLPNLAFHQPCLSAISCHVLRVAPNTVSNTIFNIWPYKLFGGS